MSPTLEEQAAACEREVKMRQRVYPRWVEGGRMTQAQADRETAAMAAAAATLRGMADAEKATGDLFGASA
jgi:hypothetical protein